MANALRTNKNLKNASFSVLLQALTIFTSFFVRIVFVHILGKEFNGLNSLFTEVISILSLAELGIGTSITYSLYEPLSCGDTKKLTRIMTLFKNAYRLIALVILAAGTALVPFIGYIVEQVSFDISYIRLIFFLFVVQTSSSYLFSYNISLLNADQRNYIISLITGIVKVLIAAANIAGLLITRSYIVYLVIQICGTLATNILVSRRAYRMYPFLREKASLHKDEKQNIFLNIKNIFIGNVSGKITNSTDNILISKLVNTAECGVYANYALIMNSIKYLFINIRHSLMGGIGNTMVTESAENIHAFHKKMTFVFFVFALMASLGFYSAADSFVTAAFGTDYVMPQPVVFICALNFFLIILREPLWGLMSVSGLFAKDKNISITGTIVNLIVSVAAGLKYGMFGVFLGTTMTLVIQIILKLILLYKEKIRVHGWDIALCWLKNGVMFFIGILLCRAAMELIHINNEIFAFLLYGMLAEAIAVLIILCAFRGTSEFKEMLSLFYKILRRK